MGPPGYAAPLPPGAYPAGHWTADRALRKARYRERLHWLDIVQWIGALVVIGSLFMPWYQLGYGRNGVSVNFSVTALATGAGGFRWLMLAFCVGVVAEGVVAAFTGGEYDASASHARVQFGLALVLLLVVVVAFFVSPFDGVTEYAVIGISKSPGAGAYLGLIACVAGFAAAVGRFVVAPPPDLR